MGNLVLRYEQLLMSVFGSTFRDTERLLSGARRLSGIEWPSDAA